MYAVVTLLIATCSVVSGLPQRWPISQPLWVLWYSCFHEAACFTLVIVSQLFCLLIFSVAVSHFWPLLNQRFPGLKNCCFFKNTVIFVDEFTLQFCRPIFSLCCPIKAPLTGLYEVQGFEAVRWEKGNWGLSGACCEPFLNQQPDAIWLPFFFPVLKKQNWEEFVFLHKVMNVVHVTALLFKDGRLVITAFSVVFPHLWIS